MSLALSTTGRLTGVSNSVLCAALFYVSSDVSFRTKAPKPPKFKVIGAPTDYRAYDLVIGRVEMAESVSKEEQGRDSAVVWRRVRLAIQHGFSHLS